MTCRAAPPGLLLLFLLSGCGGEASPLAWSIVFDGADRASTAVVATTVIEGGCGSLTTPVYTGNINLGAGVMMGPQPGELGEGLHGFRVEARGNDCSVLSAVCDDYELPLEQAEIVSTLDGTGGGGGGCSPGTECDGSGSCIPVMRDGGMDVFIPCEAEGEACDDGMGLTGVCHEGACCLGCWDGTDCQAGTTPAACGATGATCASCDPGDSCQGSTCTATSSNPAFDLSPRSIFYKDGSGAYWANGDDSMFDQLGPIAAPGDNLRGYTGSLRFADVAAAEVATAAIEIGTGNLYTWGTNGAGALGSGSTDFMRVVSEPTQIAGLETFRAVEAGAGFFCAIHTNGTLRCWGTNMSGQLGTGDTTFRAAPTLIQSEQRWISLSAGFEHACAIRDDRALFCWGKNDDGRLGDGMMIMRNAPSRVGSASDWVQVSAGVGHTCGIRLTSGERRLYCWGRTNSGVLGIGDPGGTMSFPTPQEVSGGLTGWQAVSAGNFHTCGLVDRSMGGVEAFCWGFPGFGALGNGSTMVTAQDPIPVDLTPNSGWTAITAGHDQSCGIASGVAYCWGDARDGWLGVGMSGMDATPSSPIEVIFDPPLP